MIIDFHTHVFPDRIAEKTVSTLANAASITPYANGTAQALSDSMKRAGIDLSVNLPVLTSPKQFDSVLSFAKGINEAYEQGLCPIISFAGIHPMCDDIEGKIRLIKDSGFLGVKIHPDYQGAFINDEGYIRILEAAKECDLIVVTHAGIDAAFREAGAKCPPKLAKEVVRKVKHPKFVLAHLGGSEQLNEVLEVLCGEDVYFDTAYSLPFTEDDVLHALIKRHGAEKILFATDSPWGEQSAFAERIASLPISAEDKNKIFSENAKAILGM